MERRNWLKWLALFIALTAGIVVAESAEETPGTPTPTPGVTSADLEQQLKSGLKARRPEEFAFISSVVQKVKANQLSIELVQSTYLWAKRKQPYPYPFFERGLKERAARAGISL
ncbi:MAG: hypothetical protein U1A77_02780 [Pirellulales bacterium]